MRSACIAVRETFSNKFQKYLDTRDGWFGYLDNYRHALAHRIPLYVAPYTLRPSKLDEHKELERRKREAHEQRNFHLWLRLDAEQEAIGTFTPWMMHSFSEGTAPVAFHPQMLADWNTVVEMADNFRKEINPSL